MGRPHSAYERALAAVVLASTAAVALWAVAGVVRLLLA